MNPIINGNQLALDRCPHCRIAKPLLKLLDGEQDSRKRYWAWYKCSSCDGHTMTFAGSATSPIVEVWPKPVTVSPHIPDRARDFLRQAQDSLNAPSGAVMLACSSVDAMLKARGLKEGKLSPRIQEAVRTHLITSEMGDWAHEVRLDANDERHADELAEMPSLEDATRVVGFAEALGEFLFDLPARVAEGRASRSKPTKPTPPEAPNAPMRPLL